MLQLDGGVVIQEDFLPLTLGTSDVILGVQWLEKLGNIVTNWKSKVMQFDWGDNTVTLVCDPSLVRSKISLKAMLRTLMKEKQGYRVEINKMEKQVEPREETTMQEVPSFLANVVQRHKEVFAEKTRLPPSRGHEHVIQLKAVIPWGSGPTGIPKAKKMKSRK